MTASKNINESPRSDAPAPQTPLELRLHAAEEVGAGLARLATLQTRAALRIIEHPGADREKDIHDVRVAIKRLRAYLRLIRPFLQATMFRRETGRLRTAARELAPWRDAMVARETLVAMAEKATHRRDRAAFKHALTWAKNVKLGWPTMGNQEAALRKAGKAFLLVERAFTQLGLPERGWLALAPGLEKVYRQNRRWLRRATAQNDDDAFHEWRKQAKYLFYQLQIIAPAAPKQLGKMIKCLKRLQDVLGDDHDLVVLEHMLHSHPAKFGGAKGVQRLADFLERQRCRLRKKARRLGEKLYAAKPRAFSQKLEHRWQHWNDW